MATSSAQAITAAGTVRPRDAGLDGLRGAACALMVLAHTYTPADGSLARYLFYLGGFAPALFFAVAGALAVDQARRKPLHEMLPTYAAVYVLGITYNLLLTTLPPAMEGAAQPAAGGGLPLPTAFFSCDILQIIAIGVLATAWLSRLHGPGVASSPAPTPAAARFWVATGALLALHGLLSPLVPAFPGAQILFAVGKEHGAEFPALAWTPVFLLGAIASGLTPARNLALAGAAALVAAALLALSRAGWPLPAGASAALCLSKEFVSPPYFAATAAVVFAGFAGMRLAPRVLGLPPLPLLGRESLVFLYLHMIVIVILRRTDAPLSPLLWIVVLATVALLAVGCQRVRPRTEWLFDHAAVWAFLAMVGLGVPWFASAWPVVFSATAGTGLLFAVYQRSLAAIMRRPARSTNATRAT